MNAPPLLFSRRRAWRPLLRVLLTLGVLLLVAWGGGFLLFTARIPRQPPSGPATEGLTDAIVVLTGGSERLSAGVELLSAGRAGKLFVSGVYHGVDVEELLRVARLTPHKLECCIVLGYAADNTEGNASETANWVRSEGFRSLRLVTANYHMARSLLEFRIAMPEVEIVPHPVAPPHVRLVDWWQWRGTTALLVSEYNKYLAALARIFLFSDMPG